MSEGRAARAEISSIGLIDDVHRSKYPTAPAREQCGEPSVKAQMTFCHPCRCNGP